MKFILSLVALLFSVIIVSGQKIYVGIKSGGSKWIQYQHKYTGITPDVGVFVRAEPIKRLSFEVSISKYSLHRGYSTDYIPGSEYAVKQDLSCNEIGVLAQYNYLRMFKGHLKLYAGLDCEPSFVNLTTQEYNVQHYKSPIIPYQKVKTDFLFYLIGINQTILYDLGRVNAMFTIYYRNNSSGFITNESYYPGSIRLGLQGGISYRIL